MLMNVPAPVFQPRARGPRQIEGPGGSAPSDHNPPVPDGSRRVVRHSGEVLLLGYHEEPEKSQTRIRSTNKLLPDHSKRVITPMLPGEKKEGERKEGKKKNTTEPTPAKETGPKDYLTGDVKFIITVALGFVVIIVLVYLIPRVRKIQYMF